MPGLYVHVPFCYKKCPYCAFYSLPYGPGTVGPYAGSLLREAELRSQTGFNGFGTVYTGGGTPTSLPAGMFGGLLEVITEISGSGYAEFTVEANPGTLTQEHLASMEEHGVTRISLGVQSFNPGHLKTLGRIHSAEEAEQAFTAVRDAGFGSSIDLMFALPGQSLKDWEDDLRWTADLKPGHVSLYGLSLEPGTPFAARYTGTDLPDGESYADQYEAAVRILGETGYEHYEISNFALPGKRCEHNMNYWRHGTYLGLGPGAHSFDGIRRWWNVSDLDRYYHLINKGQAPEDEREKPDTATLKHEMIFLALRTSDGLEISVFNKRFDDDFLTGYASSLEKYGEAGCLVIKDGRVRLTEKGFLVANEVFADFG